MVSALLSRAIRTIYLSGIALGMTAAVAQEATVTLEQVGDGVRWTENVVAYSDPEGEVGNGTDPPNLIEPQPDVDNDADTAMESYNFPETEIGNGTFPPTVNP